jgi:hypothetical protein
MTLPEIKGFLRAISRKQTDKQIAFVIGVNLGAQGDSKTIKRSIQELESTFRKACKNLS